MYRGFFMRNDVRTGLVAAGMLFALVFTWL